MIKYAIAGIAFLLMGASPVLETPLRSMNETKDDVISFKVERNGATAYSSSIPGTVLIGIESAITAGCVSYTMKKAYRNGEMVESRIETDTSNCRKGNASLLMDF